MCSKLTFLYELNSAHAFLEEKISSASQNMLRFVKISKSAIQILLKLFRRQFGKSLNLNSESFWTLRAIHFHVGRVTVIDSSWVGGQPLNHPAVINPCVISAPLKFLQPLSVRLPALMYAWIQERGDFSTWEWGNSGLRATWLKSTFTWTTVSHH